MPAFSAHLSLWESGPKAHFVRAAEYRPAKSILRGDCASQETPPGRRRPPGCGSYQRLRQHDHKCIAGRAFNAHANESIDAFSGEAQPSTSCPILGCASSLNTCVYANDEKLCQHSQFMPQVRTGARPVAKISQVKMFVRAVQIVGILSPTQKECIESQQALEACHHGNGPALANHHWRDSERRRNRLFGSRHVPAGRIEHERRAAVPGAKLELCSR